MTHPRACDVAPGPLGIALWELAQRKLIETRGWCCRCAWGNRVLYCWPLGLLSPANIHESLAGSLVSLHVGLQLRPYSTGYFPGEARRGPRNPDRDPVYWHQNKVQMPLCGISERVQLSSTPWGDATLQDSWMGTSHCTRPQGLNEHHPPLGCHPSTAHYGHWRSGLRMAHTSESLRYMISSHFTVTPE